MRALHMGLALAPLFLLALANLTTTASPDARNIGPIGPVPLLVDDVVYVFFSPPLKTAITSCSSLDGGPYRQLMTMNESITSVPVQLGGGWGSYAQLIPQTAGHYDMTLNVTSLSPFTMMLGVLTKDTSNFTPYKIYNVEQAYFVEILTMHALEAGNWSFSLSFSVTAVKGESSWFNIPIPSTVGILFLGVAIVGLAYPNAYLFTDLYYRSKKEEVSKKRKVGIGIALIVSLIVIYWVYIQVR